MSSGQCGRKRTCRQSYTFFRQEDSLRDASKFPLSLMYYQDNCERVDQIEDYTTILGLFLKIRWLDFTGQTSLRDSLKNGRPIQSISEGLLPEHKQGWHSEFRKNLYQIYMTAAGDGGSATTTANSDSLGKRSSPEPKHTGPEKRVCWLQWQWRHEKEQQR